MASDVELLKVEGVGTPLGPMIAIGDQRALYLLEFVDRNGLKKEIGKLRQRFTIVPGITASLEQIKEELDLYFRGELTEFKTPLHMIGTPFQIEVWNALQKIPFGTNCSYTAIAKMVNKPLAVRAVARANGANQLCMIIPCHRIIGMNGDLTGYGGGLARKKWLLSHEKLVIKKR